MHAEHGMVRTFNRRAADAIITVAENFYAKLLIFLQNKKITIYGSHDWRNNLRRTRLGDEIIN